VPAEWRTANRKVAGAQPLSAGGTITVAATDHILAMVNHPDEAMRRRAANRIKVADVIGILLAFPYPAPR